VTNSRLRARLREKGLVRVAGMNRVTEPWYAELAGKIGFDVVWFDMEHRAHSFEMVDRVSAACRASGVDLMVRLRNTGYTAAMRALEFGANGIMAPHCRSVQDAKQWVDWTKFPPLGKRGFDGAGADADYGLTGPHDYIQHANRETFVVVQIEDREAIDSIEAIASVEGLDGFFVGPADLSISYGVPMQREHARVQAALDRVAEACVKSGKWWGTVTSTPEEAQREIDRGARMITCADDHFLLVMGLQEAFQKFSTVSIRTK
jgi:4-hydroxy-2-oxoheptanedioate aldolase